MGVGVRTLAGCPLPADSGRRRPLRDELAHGTERPRTVEEHRHQIETRLRIIEESIRKALEIGGGVLIR
ncbi:hypothetical protein ACWDBW_36675 [Streptomyces sp. NPDC001107]